VDNNEKNVIIEDISHWYPRLLETNGSKLHLFAESWRDNNLIRRINETEGIA
jgi:hypothetical protein